MISIIGTGKVGSSTAFILMLHGLDNLMLIDVVSGLPQGIALDLNHAASILGVDIDIKGSNDFKDIKNSDLVIVTAGFPRVKGMSREDLITKNADIILNIAEKIKAYAPESIVLLTTNPVDLMTYLMYKKLGFSRNKVIGFSGILDSGRYRYYLYKKLAIKPSNINAYVIGQHGDRMVPLHKHSNVAGVPIKNMLTKSDIKDIEEKTIKAGGEIIKLCGFSSMYGPATGLYLAAESIIRDKKKLFIMCVYLDGEYGINDVAIGVPVILGKDGVEKIVELPLDNEDLDRFRSSVESVKSRLSELSKYII